MLLPVVRCMSAVFWLPPGTWSRGRIDRARVMRFPIRTPMGHTKEQRSQTVHS